jgi:hypothetical protein
MGNSKGTHDSMVEYIDYRLNHSKLYDIVQREQVFDCNGKTLMEIDNYAIRQGKNNRTYLLIFEDKSSDKHPAKAYSQLEREYEYARLVLKKNDIKTHDLRVFRFYVHDWQKPKIDWVRDIDEHYEHLKHCMNSITEMRENNDLMRQNFEYVFVNKFISDFNLIKRKEDKQEIINEYIKLFMGGYR